MLALLVGAFFLLTGSQPLVPQPPTATAPQVERTRAVFQTITASRATGAPSQLSIGQADVDAASAMVSQGFAPIRVGGVLDDDSATFLASRPLLFRWINVSATATGASEGFPDLRVKVGALTLPQWASRGALKLVRRLLILRGADLPALDAMVPSTDIEGGRLTAQVLLPPSGLVDQARSLAGMPIEDASIEKIFCRLAAQQRKDPQPLFATQVRRAIAASPDTASGHAEALVALAMFTVEPGMAAKIGAGPVQMKDCGWTPQTLLLQGRADSPKHWAMSAALEVATGNQFTTAMGEWKELADSLSSQPELAQGDPSGFSFVDIAADRAGFLTAGALIDPDRLHRKRATLLKADDGDLLPAAALRLSDGLTNRAFTKRYGGTDDPRFAAKVRQIDAMLKEGGID